MINYKKERTPIESTNAIAHAVRQAVCDATSSTGFRRCHIEAHVGAKIASAFTSTNYEFKAVSLTLLINHALGATWWDYPSQIGELRAQTHATPEFTDRWQIEHCFAISDDDEIIDFSSWQYKEYFKRKYDVKWDFSPSYFWGPLTDVPFRYRRWYPLHGAADVTSEVEELLEKRDLKIVNTALQNAHNSLTNQGFMPVSLTV